MLALVEAQKYHGIVSSHSWSNNRDYPRILARGGVVTPYAGSSTGFVDQWKKVRKGYDRRFYTGFGYGADMNGFGSQGSPRNPDKNPVKYPFKSLDGKVTLDKQHSGERVYDVNTDGMSHYGLYPDWIEDLRMIAGDQIVKEMARGAEAYLQMWERAEGIRPAHRCPAGGGDFEARSLKRMRLGMTPVKLLKTVRRQPLSRGRVWRYCVREPRTYERARNFAVFTRRRAAGDDRDHRPQPPRGARRRPRAGGAAPGIEASRPGRQDLARRSREQLRLRHPQGPRPVRRARVQACGLAPGDAAALPATGGPPLGENPWR